MRVQPDLPSKPFTATVIDRFGLCWCACSAANKPAPQTVQDIRRALEDRNVDAVHINSPIPDHAPMSLAALRAGKHVMCTVPMATTIEECQ